MVSLVVLDDHFDHPQGFPFVRMGEHAHFVTPEGELKQRNNVVRFVYAFACMYFVCMGELAHFITPEGETEKQCGKVCICYAQ